MVDQFEKLIFTCYKKRNRWSLCFPMFDHRSIAAGILKPARRLLDPPPPAGRVMCSVCGSVSRDRPAPLSVTSLPSPSSRFLISWWDGYCCKCALLWKMSHTKSRLLLREMNDPPMFIFVVQPDYKLKVANINFCFKCRHPSFEWFIVIIVVALFREFRRYSRLLKNQHVLMQE